MFFLSVALQAQNLNIKGKALDTDGYVLPGTAVRIQGTTTGVTTNDDGDYVLNNVPVGSVLEFILVGYVTQQIKVSRDKTIINAIMAEASESLDEVTVVAFGTQKTESVVASITTVKPSELKVPSSNLTTALAGRIAGLISYQRNGEPGQDNAQFFIRGVTSFGTGKVDPLILIDGVEMTSEDLARLTVDDIGSFSIMKDANATALYGARGANGVILVTTKNGKEGKVKIQLRMETSYSAPTQMVELADPVTYMRLHNEAVRNRDKMIPLPYTSEKILNTEKGIDPVRYPAVDWQGLLFNDYTINHRYNLNVSGGGNIVRYYVAANYARDNGIINMDKRNDFNSNIAIHKYGLRANVNIDVTKTTEMIVRLHGAFDYYSGPLDGGTDLFNKARHANPVYFLPYYEPDEANFYAKHILFGNYQQGGWMNPYAEMLKGYRTGDRSNMLAQLELKQKLDFITKGLSARAMFNVNRFSLLQMTNSYNPFFYTLAPEIQPGDYQLVALNPESGTDYLESKPSYKENTASMYIEAVLQYNREWNEKHSVSGLLVYTLRESKDGNAANLQAAMPHRNLGLAGRLTYGYASRYFLETNFGYNGSERFAENERFGFFPSIGAGWIVTNENFMKASSKTLSKLKLKATYGLVGNDAIGNASDRFYYLSQVNLRDPNKGFSFGSNWDETRTGISISRYADPNITWEISRKVNLGFELNLWNSLEIQLDYFTEKRSNILQLRSYITTTMGLQATPSANIGKATGRGFDMSVDYSKVFREDLWMVFRGNFTYAVSIYDVYEENDFAQTPWRSHKGRKLSQRYGYIAEHLFVDENEVKNSPFQQFSEYGEGDIKYKDINGDLVIGQEDLVPIGFPDRPEIIYGFGISTGYKNMDFSCFFQGSARSSFWINPSSTAPFVNSRAMLKYYADDHWSEDDRNIYALWPRLAPGNISNNEQTSTWFMRNGAFLRLKTVEIGYQLPKRLSSLIRADKFRIYVSGSNLLLFSKFKMWDVEMAGEGLNYPVQRVFNFGVDIGF
jgi:TonB-linked SusC/RagA family outer membrane protein